MRVLFDGFWWEGGPPSGRRVVNSLVRAWRDRHPEDELLVAVPRAVDAPALPDGVACLRYVSPQHAVAVVLELPRLKRRCGAEFVISQTFTPPTRDAYVFVHDVLFKSNPEWFNAVERRYFALGLSLLQLAAGVLTSTESEAARLRRHCPAAASRVLAVGLGLPLDYAEAQAVESPLPADFILAVGRLNVRKNIAFAAEKLVASNVVSSERPLLIVGTANGRAERGGETALPSTRHGPEDPVRYLGNVEDSALRGLYRSSSCFLFPSLGEGFGLPLLEAALEGARMAVSDLQVFKEVLVGSAGVEYFDPRDGAALCGAVKASLVKPTPDYSSVLDRWTWDRVVDRTRTRLLRDAA